MVGNIDIVCQSGDAEYPCDNMYVDADDISGKYVFFILIMIFDILALILYFRFVYSLNIECGGSYACNYANIYCSVK